MERKCLYSLLIWLLLSCLPLWSSGQKAGQMSDLYTEDSLISDVISDPAFADYGRLIFPVDNWYYSGRTLAELRLTWYSNISPDNTVAVVNYLKSHAEAGETIFYDIYTGAEKIVDPSKQDTGLFFFRGDEGSRFAICSAGAGLPMSVQCRTASLMPLSYQSVATMHLS